MSNELPWKVWTPDDLAPPMAEFILADHSETPLSEESDEPELSAEQQRAAARTVANASP